RHTRFSRDWSSDVCSSDLIPCKKSGSDCARFGLWRKIFFRGRWLSAFGGDFSDNSLDVGDIWCDSPGFAILHYLVVRPERIRVSRKPLQHVSVRYSSVCARLVSQLPAIG